MKNVDTTDDTDTHVDDGFEFQEDTSGELDQLSDLVEDSGDNVGQALEAIANLLALESLVDSGDEFTPTTECYFNYGFAMVQESMGVDDVKLVNFGRSSRDPRTVALEGIASAAKAAWDWIWKQLVRLKDWVKSLFKRIYDMLNFKEKGYQAALDKVRPTMLKIEREREELIVQLDYKAKSLRDQDKEHAAAQSKFERTRTSDARRAQNKHDLTTDELNLTKAKLEAMGKTESQLKADLQKYKTLFAFVSHAEQAKMQEQFDKEMQLNDNGSMHDQIVAILNRDFVRGGLIPESFYKHFNTFIGGVNDADYGDPIGFADSGVWIPEGSNREEKVSKDGIHYSGPSSVNVNIENFSYIFSSEGFAELVDAGKRITKAAKTVSIDKRLRKVESDIKALEKRISTTKDDVERDDMRENLEDAKVQLKYVTDLSNLFKTCVAAYMDIISGLIEFVKYTQKKIVGK